MLAGWVVACAICAVALPWSASCPTPKSVAKVIAAAKTKATKRGAVREVVFMVRFLAVCGVSMHAVSASPTVIAMALRQTVGAGY